MHRGQVPEHDDGLTLTSARELPGVTSDGVTEIQVTPAGVEQAYSWVVLRRV